MTKKITYGKLTWLNIIKPEYLELEKIRKKFNFHPLDIQECQILSRRPKLEIHVHYLFMIFHVPLFDKKLRKTYSGEIDFFVTKDQLITVTHETIHPFNLFFNQCNLHDHLRKKFFSAGPVYLFYQILDNLFEAAFPKLDHIDEKIDAIEDKIFKGQEKKMVGEISLVARDILNFRKILKPQLNFLNPLLAFPLPFAYEKERIYFRQLIGKINKIWDTLENHKEMLESLEETNDSLLSFKLNETMKILTVVTVITLPLAVLMNVFDLGNIPAFKNIKVFTFAFFSMTFLIIFYLLRLKMKRW